MSPSSSSSSREHLPFPHNHVTIPPQFHSMIAGAGAGLVASITTCPLDVVKTRLQAQHIPKGAEGYESVSVIISKIWRSSGPKGFYRGLGPTLAGYLPTWGIYFTVYDLVKDRLGGWNASHGEYYDRVWETGRCAGEHGGSGDGGHPKTRSVVAREGSGLHIAGESEGDPAYHLLPPPIGPLQGNTAIVHIFAAMTAGATGTIMTNPLWVVKTRFMAQAGTTDPSSRYRTTIGAIRSIYRTEGFRAFYKGLLPSLMGVSHVAVQFPLYEKAKSWADSDNGDHSSLPPTTILACSAFSKMIASICTYPHEVLRTRLQIRKSSSSSSGAVDTGGGKSKLHPQSIPTKPSSSPLSSTTLYSPLVTGNQPPHPNLQPPSVNNPIPNPLPKIDPKPPWYKQIIHKPRAGGAIDTFLQIKKQDGWRGFYRGLSVNLVRTVPNSAVTMLT
uniref:Solute carrier family 25 (Mitochondrial folate transporter), member 32 n=1 Tax=Kwoniella bestiolae CBS 10118 TaxID=1296100 RepID=A0A1B9GG67_9TREE|nr:hypothetical protein I302_01475 [Kwoniella bestiolae CBS 10118]OCF29961.1 hypothetical protein I302_01475 [Kwoniella bestiolae CBS 10118]